MFWKTWICELSPLDNSNTVERRKTSINQTKKYIIECLVNIYPDQTSLATYICAFKPELAVMATVISAHESLVLIVISDNSTLAHEVGFLIALCPAHGITCCPPDSVLRINFSDNACQKSNWDICRLV